MRSLGYCSSMTRAVSELRRKWLLPEMESEKNDLKRSQSMTVILRMKAMAEVRNSHM